MVSYNHVEHKRPHTAAIQIVMALINDHHSNHCTQFIEECKVLLLLWYVIRNNLPAQGD